jgi:SAM-dependent methyltransferase
MTVNGPRRTPVGSPREYLPGVTMSDYLDRMRGFPRFLPTLRLDPWVPAFRLALRADDNEFDTDASGRGDSYRIAQRATGVRLIGVRTLLEGALDGPVPSVVPDDFRLLDVLGGDGTLARALAMMTPGAVGDRQWILTGDLSRHMVAAALRYRLPAVCQPAQRLALHDSCFDAVVLAYGTHHIPIHERKTAYAEAWRVLKPGGRIVVHDFEEGGNVARWFREVVHRYSSNGHPYDHFRSADLVADLAAAGFDPVDVRPVYDPFVVRGATADVAVADMCSYVFRMYGLFGLRGTSNGAGWRPRVWDLINRYMTYSAAECPGPTRSVAVEPDGSGYRVTMPRVAIVGAGVKPAGVSA